MRDRIKDALLTGQKRDEKSPTPGGIRTHVFSATRRVLYPCTTAAALQAAANDRVYANKSRHFNVCITNLGFTTTPGATEPAVEKVFIQETRRFKMS